MPTHRTGGRFGPARGPGGDDRPPWTVRGSGLGTSGRARLVRGAGSAAGRPAVGGLRAKPRRSRRAVKRSLLAAVVTGPRHAATCLSSGRCFFHDTATTEIYALSLHDALPTSGASARISG